ncbi:MAG: hypothetical protein GWN33_16065, partial [Gammaproteobacteria bacterium]|nr:hypothetical protein [Gammaproteobacteria bacterium]
GKKKVNPEILNAIAEMSKIAYEMQREAVQAFLKENVQLAIAVFGKMRFMREKEEALLKKILEKTRDVDT